MSTALLAVPAPVLRCPVDDPRLAELSGLAANGDGLWAMADGGRRVQVHRLDPDGCGVRDTRTADVDPVDPEDLARGADDTLWVADIGDNGVRRDTVAIIELPADGPARLHRLTYPDGPHDAEALLIDATGRPIVVVKDAGPAGVYRTEAPPDGVGPTPLLRVGQVVLPPSDTTGGPLAGLGSRLVTGAAISDDGRVVGLRSYTDAWLYRVPADGDLVAALTGRPVRVPLPDEPQGEAIAFEPSGTLVSGSETRGGAPGGIRTIADAASLVADDPTGSDQPAPHPGTPDSTAAPDVAVADPAAPDQTPEWLPAVIGAGALGGFLLLVMIGLALRATRRR